MSNQPPSITSPPLRKLVRVPIIIESLAEWVKQDTEIHYKCVTGLPPGAELDLCKVSEDRKSLVLFFKHDSFEAVEASVFVPEFKCVFESLAPPVESQIPSAQEQEEQPEATQASEPLPE